MTSARAGRRRRLLQDGASTASGVGIAAISTDATEPGSTQRYAFRDSSVSVAIGRGIVPRSWAALAGATVALGTVVAGLVALDSYGLAAAAAQAPAGRLLMLDGVGSVATWIASATWLSVAVMSLVVFGMRRQRMDDVNSVYRWWLVGALAAVVLSFNATTQTHHVVSALLSGSTGFSPLPGDAFWWLAIGVPVLGLIAVRLVIDASASRLGAVAALCGLAVLAFGWVYEAQVANEALAGLMPAALPLAKVGPACVLAGPLVLLVSLLLVNRHILAEAEGKVAAPQRKSSASKEQQKAADRTPAKTKKAAKAEAKSSSTKQAEPSREARRTASRDSEVAKPTVWTNGADDYSDAYEEEAPKRKLSKAERKRLRRQKARDAA